MSMKQTCAYVQCVVSKQYISCETNNNYTCTRFYFGNKHIVVSWVIAASRIHMTDHKAQGIADTCYRYLSFASRTLPPRLSCPDYRLTNRLADFNFTSPASVREARLHVRHRPRVRRDVCRTRCAWQQRRSVTDKSLPLSFENVIPPALARVIIR